MAFSDAIRVAEAAANRQALDVKDQEAQQDIAVELLKELGLDLVAELEKRDAQKSALVKLKERIWDFGGTAPPKAILIQEVWILGDFAVTAAGTFHRYRRIGADLRSAGGRVYAAGLHSAGTKFSKANGYFESFDDLHPALKPAVQNNDESAGDVFHLRDKVLCWGREHTQAQDYFAALLVVLPSKPKP